MWTWEFPCKVFINARWWLGPWEPPWFGLWGGWNKKCPLQYQGFEHLFPSWQLFGEFVGKDGPAGGSTWWEGYFWEFRPHPAFSSLFLLQLCGWGCALSASCSGCLLSHLPHGYGSSLEILSPKQLFPPAAAFVVTFSHSDRKSLTQAAHRNLVTAVGKTRISASEWNRAFVPFLNPSLFVFWASPLYTQRFLLYPQTMSGFLLCTPISKDSYCVQTILCCSFAR